MNERRARLVEPEVTAGAWILGQQAKLRRAEADAKRLADAAVIAAYRLHAKHLYYGGPIDWRICGSRGCQEVASALGLAGYRPKDGFDPVTRADLKYALQTNDLPRRVAAREALRQYREKGE